MGIPEEAAPGPVEEDSIVAKTRRALTLHLLTLHLLTAHLLIVLVPALAGALSGARAEPAAPDRAEIDGYPDRGARHEAAARAPLADESKPRREVGEKFRDCPECPEMVVVPAGSYDMGSPSYAGSRFHSDGPVHRVTISDPFAVGVHEVTRGEWSRFVSETGHAAGDSCWTYETGEWKEHSGRGWRDPGFGQGSGHPAVCVSWADARAYVDWLSDETGAEYRLLSESEWEYVARGGSRTSRHWGTSESGQCSHANGADRSARGRYVRWRVAPCDDGHVHTAPVGSFRANGFGLHDVLGNAWEWVEDCWHDTYEGGPSDGSAWADVPPLGRLPRTRSQGKSVPLVAHSGCGALASSPGYRGHRCSPSPGRRPWARCGRRHRAILGSCASSTRPAPSSRRCTTASRPWGAWRSTSSSCSSGNGSTSSCTRRGRRGRPQRSSRSVTS